MQKKAMLTAAGLLLAVYLGAYLSLSRRGYAEADRLDLEGFYYFTPQDTDVWRYKNNGCMLLFWPLNFIDRTVGTGRYPAHEPLWSLGLLDLKHDCLAAVVADSPHDLSPACLFAVPQVVAARRSRESSG